MLFNYLNSRFFLVFLFPLFLGTLTIFTFQPFNYSYLNFFIIPSLFLTTTYVQKKSKNTYREKPYLLNLFLIGYLFGVGFFLTGTYWISNSLTFDESFKFLIPFALIGLPIFLGLFFGFSILLAGPFIKNNFISILLFCSALAFVDFLRAKLFSGFPWNLWAYSWSWKPELLQGLSHIDFFSFNYLTILFFCSPLLLIFKKKKEIIIFLILLTIFFGNYIYGSSIIKNNNNKIIDLDLNSGNSIYTKIISPNFDLEYNLTESNIEENILKLIKYSDPDKSKKTLFVWPEGILSGYHFEQIKKFEYLFKEAFADNHIVLFGVNYEVSRDDQIDTFNSLVIVNNKLEVLFKYNKIKLVPFGEFLPFENILNKIGLKKITQGHGSFTSGKDKNIFLYESLKLLPLICYEIIFPEMVKINEEKNLIVNISQDAWFGKTVGPYQHFAKAIFRAIESETFLVRSANQGLSAFIDNKGIVKKVLKPNEVGSIELNVPFINTEKKIKKFNLIFFALLITSLSIFFVLRKYEK
jgi:apolipoprotein N-acyltransferase